MKEIAVRWNRFWFAPSPTSTLAVVRIAYGIVVLAWSLSLAADPLRLLLHVGPGSGR